MQLLQEASSRPTIRFVVQRGGLNLSYNDDDDDVDNTNEIEDSYDNNDAFGDDGANDYANNNNNNSNSGMLIYDNNDYNANNNTNNNNNESMRGTSGDYDNVIGGEMAGDEQEASSSGVNASAVRKRTLPMQPGREFGYVGREDKELTCFDVF